MNLQDRKATRDRITQELRDVLTSLEGATDITADELTPRTRLEYLNLDSLCLSELSVAIGQKFTVEIDAAQLSRIKTIAGLVRRIQRLTRRSAETKVENLASV